MKSKAVSPTLLLLGTVPFVHLAQAHTRFTTLHINGISQGDGKCIRQDQNPDTTTNFLPSLTDPSMACGVDGSLPVPDTCTINPGDSISLEHREWPDASQPGAIDVSHKGNTAIYMKRISSLDDEVTGDGWCKIFWDGYDTSTGLWGTDHMNENNGLVTTTVPNDLAAGLYLVRSEVLALQEVGEPQFYVGCAQIRLEGVGSTFLSDTVHIPGYVSMETSAMNVNIYESFTFEEYGPKVYGSGGGSGANGNAATAGVGKNGNLGSSGSPASVSGLISYHTANKTNETDTCDSKEIGNKGNTDICDKVTESDADDDDCENNHCGYGDWEDLSDKANSDNANSNINDNVVDTSSTDTHTFGHSWVRWNNAHRRVRRSIMPTSIA